MKIIISALVIFLMSVPTSYAFDGEISFSYLNNSTARAYPSGGKGDLESIAHMDIGHEIKSIRLYTYIDTLIDNLNADDGMHPSSVRFGIGGEYHFKHVFVGLEHMCWHQIDGGGRGDQFSEQYSSVKIGVKFGKPVLK